MATVIKTANRTPDTSILTTLGRILPYKLFDAVRCSETGLLEVEEIRCRRGRRLYLTCGGRNISLPVTVTEQDIASIFDSVCGGSLYAHKDSLAEGYVTLDGGLRAGIVGRAVFEGGQIIGVYDVSAINLRIPRSIRVSCRQIADLLCDGVLIYSKPGVGKTTLLRSLALSAASGESPLRVAVVDTRGEIGAFLDGEGASVDILTGYPKAKGIEIAVRTMNPQLIVCDEIGVGEADSISAAQNCGVPLLASVHGSSVEKIMQRAEIRRLHASGVFGYYVGIERSAYGFEYRITEHGEVSGVS